MMGTTITADEFRAAMARFPGVVTIVTANSGKERLGLTATAVSSVTADPPSLLVCVNKATGTCAVIRENGRFVVNLLTEAEGDLAMRFAGAGGVTGEEKFAQGDWSEDARGIPYLSSALVSLSCEVSEMIEASSHVIFIGQIAEARFGEGQPLLYEQSAFRRLGPVAA